MSRSKRGTEFIQEFNEFVTFLKNLWSILAGLSVLFPLSNALVKVIPLKAIDQDGAFAKLSPSLITALATLTTLFLILWTFSRRSEFMGELRRRPIQRRAAFSFGLGLLTLIIYVAVYFVKLQYAYVNWGWESEDPRHLIVEIPLGVAYVASFALVTRAFLLLGMIEFFSIEGESHKSIK